MRVQRDTLRTLLAWAAPLLMALVPQPGIGQGTRIELHTIQSVTLTDQEFLTGRGEGAPVTLAGELRIPGSEAGRLPAVVLLHGSSGASGREDGWVRMLNDMGVATLLVDSFTGRGIVNTVNDQSRLGRLAMIIDAYRALELLARHPGLDSSRIAVMGFSRGGQAALHSSMRRFRRMYLAAPGLEFAAHIVLYSPCNMRYRADEDVVDTPIRIFQGGTDDFVAVAPCREYVERLRGAGKDARLTEYAGAGHIFDYAALKTPLRLPHAQVMKRCRLEEGEDGLIINSETRQPFSYGDACADLGATVAYDAAAHREAQAAVRALVTRVLALERGRPPANPAARETR
jgi:dienelactone hydrolase